MTIKRRTFVIGGVGAAVVGAATYAWLRERGYEVDPRPTTVGKEPRPPAQAMAFLPYDPRALVVLGHVVNQLLPGDETLGLPSAKETNVLEFLVAASKVPGFLPVRNDILKLTRHLDIVARKNGGHLYGDLDDTGRAAVLAEVRRGGDERRTFSPKGALEVLLRLSLEGYLGHPKHGGNKNGLAWQALSIPMPLDIEAGEKGHHH